MAVVFKSVKAGRFKDEVFMKLSEEAAEKTANDMELAFEMTVATWNEKPTFVKLFNFNDNEIEFLIGTDSEIYGYVNNGTREHDIFPVSAPVLVFKSGYKAKTMPGVMSAGAGGAYGDNVFAAYTHVKGIQPRGFEKAISKEFSSIWAGRLSGAMRKARKECGHAI